MTIEPGQQLGPYEILSPLGTGGMGEVWLARDSRLARQVAIKLLPGAFAESPPRVQRFRREAQLLAALNHPNIAAIYSFDTIDEVPVLAMEMVPGKTVAELLARGPLNLPLVLNVARHVADALGAAHARGILHRDLKPANVKVTPDGTVKLLDFGLAKAFAVESPGPGGAIPTIDGAETREGVVVGTASYMSPEQARGQSLDQRTDIWSFGCLLYEMLAGKKAFVGETLSHVLVAVLDREPDFSALPPSVPPSLAALVKACLSKSLAGRLPDAAAVRMCLDREAEGETQALTRPVVPRRFSRPFGLAAGAILTVAAALLVWVSLSGRDGRSLPQTKLLAILPAADFTGRPDGRAFCDGLSASLRVKLQRMPGLQIMVPSSPTLAAETDPAKWARDTGANLLVQPLVRQNGERMQMAFFVTLAGSPVQVAAGEVTGQASEPFGLEEELTGKLLASLEVQATGGGGPKAEPIPAGRSQVDYVLALGHLERWDDPASIAKAIGLLSGIPGADGSALVQAALGRACLRAYELTRDTAHAERARGAAERAIALDPDLPEALVTLARLLTAIGKPEEALDPVRKVLDRRPDDVEALLAFGRALEATGDSSAAERAFRQAAILRPTSWVVLNGLAAFLTNGDRHAEAIEIFRKASALNPDAPGVQYNLGAALFRLGRLAEAEDAFRASLAIRPTAAGWSNLGTVLYFARRYPEAVEAFERAIVLAPDDGLLWLNLGDGLSRVAGRTLEATRAYESAVRTGRLALSVNPRSAETRGLVAAALARTGQTKEAREEAGRALALEPFNPNVLFFAAVVSVLGGRTDEAASRLELGLRHGLGVAEVETEPDFSGLTIDPRFRSVLDAHRTSKEKK
jgi:tetratricopeptide (TPR) repeat protein/TolB-like protein